MTPEETYLTTAVTLRHAAMDLLARREHSRYELVTKLKSRIEASLLSDQVLEQVLDQLAAEKLLDDERFCGAFVRFRCNNGYGPVRVKSELVERGVADELSAIYLDFNGQDWKDGLHKLIVKKYGTSPDQDRNSRNKQQRFLMQRGFTFSQIKEAFQQLDSGSI